MSLVETADGISALGGGSTMQELGGGWIVRRAEETALLALMDKLLMASESFHKRVRVAYGERGFQRDARLNGEAGQILKVADQIQLIALNAIRYKVK